MKRNKKALFNYASLITFIVFLAVMLFMTFNKKVETNKKNAINPEILRSMDYENVDENDYNVDNCQYVQFSAFFTRDLDSDGKAEKLLGTCRNVNEKDVLYMDLNVISSGYIKDAKIEINGANFDYSMAMVKDSVLKYNYIDNDVKTIELNQINAGTQKLIIGNIISDIGSNKNNYSKESTIKLSGIHVNTGNGNVETKFEKTIKLQVDWHGTAKASFILLLIAIIITMMI